MSVGSSRAGSYYRGQNIRPSSLMSLGVRVMHANGWGAAYGIDVDPPAVSSVSFRFFLLPLGQLASVSPVTFLCCPAA